MGEKQSAFQGNPNHQALPLLHFQNPALSFPIVAVHAQIGLREKLIDKDFDTWALETYNLSV